MEIFSLDNLFLADRTSTYVIRLKGRKSRLNLKAGDFLIVDKGLPLACHKLAVLVRNNKFGVDIVTEDFLARHDPENGDFIWGMVRALVREVP